MGCLKNQQWWDAKNRINNICGMLTKYNYLCDVKRENNICGVLKEQRINICGMLKNLKLLKKYLSPIMTNSIDQVFTTTGIVLAWAKLIVSWYTHYTSKSRKCGLNQLVHLYKGDLHSSVVAGTQIESHNKLQNIYLDI